MINIIMFYGIWECLFQKMLPQNVNVRITDSDPLELGLWQV